MKKRASVAKRPLALGLALLTLALANPAQAEGYSLGAYTSQNGGQAQQRAAVGTPSSPTPSAAATATPPRSRSILPFWLDRQRQGMRTRALLLPPLFVDRRSVTNDRQKPFFHANLALTFGWHSDKIQGRRWLNPAALFFGGFSERSSRWISVPLLMAYSRQGEQFSFGQFPLVWWWGNKSNSNFLLIPLYFRNKRPNAMISTAGLVFWKGHRDLNDADPSNDLRYTVAGPLYVHVGTHKRNVHVAPLWLSGNNRYRGREHKTFFPFFHWHNAEFGNRQALITPVWSRSRDTARARSSWSIPPLLSFGQKSRDRALSALTPLVWFGHNERKDARFWAFANLGDYQDAQQRVTWFAPVFWRFTDHRRQAHATAVLPLAFVRRNPMGTRIDSLLFSASNRTDGWSMGVHPLLSYAGKQGDRSYAVGLAGAFWYRKPQANHWSAGLGPLAFVSKRRNGYHWGVIPLGLFAGRTPDLRYQVVTPLVWHLGHRQEQGWRDLWLGGPFYVHRDRQGSAGGMVPLVFARHGRDRSYAVVPALLSGYSKDHTSQSSRFISPLLVVAKNPAGYTLGALGAFWRVKRQAEAHTALVPLFYHRRNANKHVVVTPVGATWPRKGAQEWFFGPLFGSRSKDHWRVGLFPLGGLYRHRDPNAAIRSATVLAPLYLGVHGKQQDVDLFTPLAWNVRTYGEQPRHAFGVAPFYLGQRQPGGIDYDAGLGWIYARNPSRQTHTVIAGPYFHRLSRKRLITGMFPLVWWTDSLKQRNLFAFPLLMHHVNKEARSHVTVALPLWFDRKLSPFQRTWAAVPFAFGSERRTRFLRMSLIPPGFVDTFNLQKNRRLTGFIPLAFRWQKCGFQDTDDPACRYTLHGALPFFAYGRDGKGRRSHSVLSLYWSDRDAGGRKFYTWLGGANYRPNEKLMWYAGPVFRSTTRTHVTTGVLPLWFSRKHRTRDRSTVLALPPLFIGQHKDDARWFEAGLIAWHFRSQHKQTTLVVPPIFGYSTTLAERRALWLAPIFLDNHKFVQKKRTTAVLPGLFLRRLNGERRAVVQFPLLWHFANGATKTTVVPGLLVRRETPSRTVGVVGPALGVWWKQTLGKTTTARHWRVVFGLFGGGQDHGRRYASIFGIKIWGRAGTTKVPAKAAGNLPSTAAKTR